MHPLLTILVFASCVAWSAEDRFIVDDEAFLEKATAAARMLHEAGKLVSFEKLRAQLDRATCELRPPAPRTVKLQPRELHRLVRGSTVAVGSFFHCTKCKEWHFDTATGFVAADDVVSTCEHVVNFEDEDMKEGFLVVADSDGKVHPVTQILAANADADTCLLSVPGLGLKPLALNPGAQVGDRVFCLSHPDGNHWMFTDGMLSRFFINRQAATDAGQAPRKAGVRPSLYINITAEYSPGSSGAPVVDEFGNVVGQVESITSSIEEEEGEKGANFTTSYGMPLRACISAKEIAALIKPPAKRASRGARETR
jgi:S1-C subfamily serine protease